VLFLVVRHRISIRSRAQISADSAEATAAAQAVATFRAMSFEGNAQQPYSPRVRAGEHTDAFRRLSAVNDIPATAAGWFGTVG